MTAPDTLPARWYVIDRDGLATLCKDEDDAQNVAAECFVAYPQRAPYRAALLGDVDAVRAQERERWEKALAQAWRMVDPLKPAGTPGSYARGQDSGITAALQTVRDNRAALDATHPATTPT